MRPEIAIQQIDLFEKRFGQPHLHLACHAAFPLALTPDLLYRLWASFQRDVQNQPLEIRWVAVSEILLSGLCYEVGHDLYEMEAEIRVKLLKRLKADERFGQERILQLANFLTEYIQQQLYSDDPDVRDFATSQQWTVLAYTQPTVAARQIAKTFNHLIQDTSDPERMDKPELVRMASLVETFAEPLAEANLEPLIIYAQGMASFARGDLESATVQLSKVTEEGMLQVAGVDVPIPEQIKDNLDDLRLPIGPDYSGQDLRGRSFKGQDLTRANFSDTDIRGADFSHATLIRANFSRAKAGLQIRWVIGLIVCSFFLAALAGITSAVAGWILGVQFNAGNVPFWSGGFASFIAFAGVCIFSFRRILQARESTIALTIVGIVAIASFEILTLYAVWETIAQYGQQIIGVLALTVGVAIAVGLVRTSTVRKYQALPTTVMIGGAGVLLGVLGSVWIAVVRSLQMEQVTVILAVSVAIVASGAIAIVIAGLGTWKTAMATVLVAAIAVMFWLFNGSEATEGSWLMSVWLTVVGVAVAWAAVLTLGIAISLVWFDSENRLFATVWSLAVFLCGSVSLLLIVALGDVGIYPPFRIAEDRLAIAMTVIVIAGLGTHMGWRALAEDHKFAFLQELTIALTATGGTSFRGSNLTSANFTESALKGADFRGATLTRIQWSQVKKLNLACANTHHAKNLQLQQLLITGEGTGRNFDHMDLADVNLRGVNLTDARFIGTNLKGADLRGANLSNARLVNTQLDGADLTGTRLTGAYVCDCQFTAATKLKAIECDYIYTHLPTIDDSDPQRQPSNPRRMFKSGEFIQFIRNSDQFRESK